MLLLLTVYVSYKHFDCSLLSPRWCVIHVIKAKLLARNVTSWNLIWNWFNFICTSLIRNECNVKWSHTFVPSLTQLFLSFIFCYVDFTCPYYFGRPFYRVAVAAAPVMWTDWCLHVKVCLQRQITGVSSHKICPQKGCSGDFASSVNCPCTSPPHLPPPPPLHITLFWSSCGMMISLLLWPTTRHYFKPLLHGIKWMKRERAGRIKQVRHVAERWEILL